MSIRHLDSLFEPSSVALVGASDKPGSLGATVWRNLRRAGFAGPIGGVNPRMPILEGDVPAHASVAALPFAPELGVVVTPPAAVPGVIAALGARGAKAAVVLTAGLDAATRQAMLDAAQPHTLRILGPNGLGLQSPGAKLDASFSHAMALPGDLAFVSQSGALVTAMLDHARGRGIGLSRLASLGEQADVDVGDLLDWLATDPKTRAILMYVESFDRARKLMSAARAASRVKPVVLVKAGRSAQGGKAAASHTGALTGSDLVVDAAIRRAGMLRVDTLDDLFVAAETLVRWRGNAADGLLVFTNGGGAGVMAADATAAAGVALTTLEPATLARLDAVLPPNWSHGNPVDIIGDAPVARYVAAWEAFESDPAARAVLFLHAPTAIVPADDIARALVPKFAPAHATLKPSPGAPPRVMASWIGGPAVAEAARIFHDAGIACYDTPEAAVHAFAMLAEYRRNQALLLEAPPLDDPQAQAASPAARAAVEPIFARVFAEGRTMLTEPEAKEVLAAFGVPVVATRVVPLDADAAVAAADALGWPVALKILSPDISHKSDVGGVVLDLGDAVALRAAVAALAERVQTRRPDARVDGVTVQTMVRRSHARELIVGASIDPVFGPVILFGHGGTSVEVVADRAVALPPLNEPLADALIRRTRVAKLLAAWRDVPAADLQAVRAALIAVSRLLAACPEVVELDINPLLADERGAIALDARVRIDASRPGGAARFAIRPYPQEMVETLAWRDGRTLTVRPVRPDDEARHLAFLESLDPETIRLRIFHTRRSIERTELARLVQIDYDREIALVATERDAEGREHTLGAVRAGIDPDGDTAEFGIVLRDRDPGLRGLGTALMRRLIDHLRARGVRRLVATVLRENDRMLRLAERLGFEVMREDGAPLDAWTGNLDRDEGDDDTRFVELRLR